MKKHHRIAICGLLIGLNLALIWGNSAMTGDDSQAMSDWVLKLLAFLPEGELGVFLVRKAAHFSEFALLGLLMGRMSTLLSGKTYPGILGLGLGCACVDETIQYYVPGRASMLTDVWIDFSGFATGLILLTIGYTIYKRKHNPEEIKL